MSQQLGGLWRWIQDQSPARQALIFITPIVGVAMLVFGALIVLSVVPALLRGQTAPAAQATPTLVQATPPANPAAQTASAEASTPVPPPVAAAPAVLVPGRDASPTPAASPTETPTPSPTNTPTPEPARSAKVVNTDGQGANMRRAPSVSAQRVKLLVEGTIVELVGGEQRGDGYTWRNVKDVDGTSGYVIADYLQPIQAPPGATAILPPPSIQIDDITSPVKRGTEATLKIITRPGVRCELRVLIYGPDTLPSDGLEAKTADAGGVCSWTWTVPDDVVPGNWRYRITAGEGEGRAVREVTVVIT
ncbi:MAG: SH3 domain-containing protein [Chloroflexota bacterium]